MDNPDALLDLITTLARVPSFTSHEHRLHDTIADYCASIDGITTRRVADNNLILSTAAAANTRPLALSAHLDKINHFADASYQQSIPIIRLGSSNDNNDAPRLRGLLDDAVGVGVCLYLLRQAATAGIALQILLSECEESSMFRGDYRALLQPGSADTLHGGIGAQRIAADLLATDSLPTAIIVVDVTPLFRGAPGIALYAAPWEKTGDTPTTALQRQTTAWVNRIRDHSPRMQLANNTNDYLTYAHTFHTAGKEIPCMALEPSVANYHSPNEEVHEADIIEVAATLRQLL